MEVVEWSARLARKTSVSSSMPTSAIIYEAYNSIIKKKKCYFRVNSHCIFKQFKITTGQKHAETKDN